MVNCLSLCLELRDAGEIKLVPQTRVWDIGGACARKTCRVLLSFSCKMFMFLAFFIYLLSIDCTFFFAFGFFKLNILLVCMHSSFVRVLQVNAFLLYLSFTRKGVGRDTQRGKICR